MFICQATLGYSSRDSLKSLSPEVYAELRRRVPSVRLPEEQSGLDRWYDYSDVILDDQDVAWLTQQGIKVEVSRIKGVASNISDSRELAQTLYQISVPNVGLLSVVAVAVLEDCCTNTLQDCLDNGWRIIAVCPPNDTRRPTYIMGHTERDKRAL